MMRRPTPKADAYAWHSRFMAGAEVARHEGEPKCGYYKRRFVKGGPFIPVHIYLEQDVDAAGELTAPENMHAFIEGRADDPMNHWTYLTPISEDEYRVLIAEHERNDLMRATHVAVDLTEKAMRP